MNAYLPSVGAPEGSSLAALLWLYLCNQTMTGTVTPQDVVAGTLDFHHQGAFWPQESTLPEAESAL